MFGRLEPSPRRRIRGMRIGLARNDDLEARRDHVEPFRDVLAEFDPSCCSRGSTVGEIDDDLPPAGSRETFARRADGMDRRNLDRGRPVAESARGDIPEALEQRAESPRRQRHHPLAQRRPAKRARRPSRRLVARTRPVPSQNNNFTRSARSASKTHRSRRRTMGSRPASRGTTAASPSIPLRKSTGFIAIRTFTPEEGTDHAAPFSAARVTPSPASRPSAGRVPRAPDHRADEDFRKTAPSSAAFSAGASNITGAKPGASDLSIARPLADSRSPSKQLLRGDPVTPRDLGHHRPHRQCLLGESEACSSDDHRRDGRPVPGEHLDPDATLGSAQAYRQTSSRADPKSEIGICSSRVVEEGAVRTALPICSTIS